VSDVGTRTLKYLLEAESANYDNFDANMQAAVLDGLITNRGLTRFKYVPASDRGPECVYGETVRWDKFIHGYARTWKKVPWISFEWDMTPDEVRQNFEGVPLDFSNLADMEDEPNVSESKQQLKGVKLIKVWEVWDKRTRKVMFFSACNTKGPLKVVDDPLNLRGFLPVPQPLNFMRKVTTLTPTPLYEHYRQQASELNEITNRLKAIIKAIKYRGAYNSAVEGIEKMLSAEDNELVPVENVQSMPDGTSMDKLLWIVPVQDLATTAQTLYQQREQVKQVIYEITGISDILRGSSTASETATAQNIKNQWGTLRLKKMQKEVQRYCRDALSIMLEIAGGKFVQKTLQQMTGAAYLTKEQKMQLTQGIQQQQMMAQQQAARQPQGQPAQQPQPPQIPPEIQQALKEPTWEDIMGLLQNDILLNYKTDVETNSTIDAEASQDKQDISELLNALSQFLNGLAPLVQQGTLSIDVAKSMLLVICRRYNFGSQLEDALDSMQQPKPQDDGKAADSQAKLQIVQAQAQTAQQQAQLDQQKMQQEMQIAQAEFRQKMQLMQMEMQVAQQELQIKQQELQMQERAVGMKLQAQTVAHQQKLAQLSAQQEAKEKEPANASD